MFHHKKILKNDIFTWNSEKIKVKKNQQYELQTNIKVIKGIKYSAYLFVILLDNLGNEKTRHISWIDKFENKSNSYQIIFTTNNSEYAIIGYRINHETPIKSEFEIEYEDIKTLKLVERSNKQNNFENISNYVMPKLDPLTEEEENILEKKTVWLLGSPRSGTTWLGTQLLNHPTNLIWDEISLGYHLGIVEQRFDPEISLSRFYDQQKNNPLYFFSDQHKNNWMPYLKKLIVARIFSFTQSLEKNVIIKEPVGGNGADIITDCMPDSKIIFLIRDGRDILDSRMDMHTKNSWANLPEITVSGRRDQHIRLYSELWNLLMDTLEKTYNKHNPKLRYKLKYEDLKSDVFSELKKLYEFLEIPITDDALIERIDTYDFNKIPSSQTGKGKFYRSARVNGWKDSFSIEEQKLMNSIMGKKLKEMGYHV